MTDIISGRKSWIDVTVAIEDGMVHWPGDIPVSIEKLSSISSGQHANVTALNMSAHTSTHMDAMNHFIDGADDITMIPFEKLIGKARVIEIRDEHQVTASELKEYTVSRGDRLLFKTKNSDESWALKDFRENYVYLSTEAALWLVEKEIACVGIDYLSIAGRKNGTEVHRMLLGAKISVIEGLDLGKVKGGIYDMICLPMKIKGSDGAPARVLLSPA